MPQSYTCLHYHLVFSTKDREPWLQAELRPRLWEYLNGPRVSLTLHPEL